MATTNEILVEIATYTAEKGRPCPAKHLTDKFGDDAADLIATLKSEGKIYGKRGRTGGLVNNDVASGSTTATLVPIEAVESDLEAEFAALAAKLAEQTDDATAVAV